MKAPRLFACLLGLAAAPIFAQKPLLNIFLDRLNGPQEAAFLKSEIQFVNYVLDAALADVQVQQTSESAGNGARRETLYFFGKGRFAGHDDTIAFVLQPTDPQGLVREKLLRAFKQGLLSYLLQTDWAASIDYALADPPSNFGVRDNWDLLTFNLRVNGEMSDNKFSDENGFFGKYSNRIANRAGSFEANVWRTGRRLRFDAGLRYGGSHQRNILKNYPFTTSGVATDTTLVERGSDLSFGGNVAYALGKRFSVGAWGDFNRIYKETPLFGNDLYRQEVAAGIEYSLVPYEDWFRRQFALGCFFNLNFVDTYSIAPNGPFGLNAYLTYARVEKWGYIGGRISADYQIARISYWNILGGQAKFSAGVNLRKGLFLTVGGDFQLTNRQTASPFNPLPTVYSVNARYRNFSTSVGIAYYFGSGYQSIINPRLWAATR